MRKIAEIRRDLSKVMSESQNLDPQKDQEAIEKGVASMKALMKELEEAEVAEKAAQVLAEKSLKDLEKKEGRAFSFVKFIREAKDGKLTGLEAEVAEMGSEEYRRLGLSQKGLVIPSCVMKAATGNGKADFTPEQAPISYVEGLRERLVVAGLGAHVLGGLMGNVPIISSRAMAAGWAEEAEVGKTGKMAISKAMLTPHRNFVAGAITGDLLNQNSPDVEAMIQNALLTAHAELIDQAAICGTGAAGQPTGILNTAGIGEVKGDTNGKAIDWKNVVALESAINAANANRGKLAYLTNGKVNGALKTTEKAANTGRFILDGNQNMVNGYPLAWTNLVPANLTKGSASKVCSAMIFGNFEDLYIGHWGGLDILIDPYTGATKGEVNYVLNSWDDVAIAEPKSFAAIKDILA